MGDVAYVAAGYAGPQIIRLRSGTPQTLSFSLASAVTSSDGPLVPLANASSGVAATFFVGSLNRTAARVTRA